MNLLAALVVLGTRDLAYTDFNIEGWTVHVDQTLTRQRPNLWAGARQELAGQLRRIVKVVPEGPLAKLRKVPLWLHLKNPVNPGAAFHPSRDWLIEHQQNPDMARCVELGNAENLISWSYQQPWMVMHELAHSYHFLHTLKGFENEDVKAAYKLAVESKRYDSILWQDGRRGKAYGLNNQMEYFAETTEAYFGVNDGYPFIRAELKEFDPAGYELMRRVWGDPAVKVPSG